MLAEFAARMNCGGADVGTTASFMREMMHSATRGSYDNVIATQTFGDDTDEEVRKAFQHSLDTPIQVSCCLQANSSKLAIWTMPGQAACCVPLLLLHCSVPMPSSCLVTLRRGTQMSMQAVGRVFLASAVY